MPRYFNAKLTSGTAYGPFTIYHTSVNASNIVIRVSTMSPATNVTRSELTTSNGVEVLLPDGATTIILYSQSCGTQYSQSLPSPSVSPSISISPTPSRTPALTVTPTSTVNPTASPTPTPTPTRTASASRTLGYAFCLGYNSLDCGLACNDYIFSCTNPASPSITPTITPSPTRTPTVTPSITVSNSSNLSFVYCLGYDSTECNVACANYFIDCIGTSPSPTPTATPSPTRNINVSASPTPTATPSISISPTRTPSISISPTATPSPSSVQSYKLTIRLKLESYSGDVGGNPGVGLLYYVVPPSGYSQLDQRLWNGTTSLGNSFLQNYGEYFYNAYNPFYGFATVTNANGSTTFNTAPLNTTSEFCDYVASVNGILRGSTVYIALYAQVKVLSSDGTSFSFVNKFIKFCRNWTSACPSEFSCALSVSKLALTNNTINSNASVSLLAPTRDNEYIFATSTQTQEILSIANIRSGYGF